MSQKSGRKELKRFVSGILARLWRRRRITAQELLAMTPRRILIVRQHNQMGDMVCATPAFRAIRETYPGAEIGLICAPVNRDVVRHNPHLDRVFLFDKRACTWPGPLLRFVRRLRTFKPELAVVLNSVSYSVTSAALAAGSGAEVIVGGDSRPFGFEISRYAYSLEMPSYPDMDRHAVAHNLVPLAAVGITTTDTTTVVVPSPFEQEQAVAIAASGDTGTTFWIMHPGAGKTENLWPTARFAAIAAKAVAAGHHLLVLQGPADTGVATAFRAALPSSMDTDSGSWRFVPPVSVGVCAGLLERADRFLCNDTGLMHVAGAVGVPTLALFGPTDPELWAPRNRELTAMRAPGNDLESLSEAEVWETFSRLPGRSDRKE